MTKKLKKYAQSATESAVTLGLGAAVMGAIPGGSAALPVVSAGAKGLGLALTAEGAGMALDYLKPKKKKKRRKK
jgi:hypothetical protein